ncbi:DNA-binding transcriptional LysR family regulator [Rhodobium orientis]|uniref:Transcriptional regulator n=1 Tax=Rhodobium orientis TaxID=34017 RepID=A0A327JXX1_9HYPH|nr:LysR family transcriptional regulator [Rhodobium orientis]MBB4302776.1 DNA-binding transcriptional LysR family regulator [Rhodobium orientis]MBK5948556.1 transcriptional regulator [Rhodobium orientis]RAI29822.1 transcriptional regulator [Rhodobium orientis]
MTTLRRRLPSPGSLFVFEAAARCENFTHAAAELNVTQPAVSRALAMLEAHIGAQLFQRGRPGVRLTEDGKRLKTAVQSAFAEVEEALHEIEERRTGKSQVTISVSTAFTNHWLMPRITRFQTAFPDVDLRFQLIPGPVTGGLGDVDIAMRYGAPGEIPGRFIMQEAYVPVCAPGYLQTMRGGSAALILLEGDAPDRLASVETRSLGTPHARLTFSDYSVVVQAALVGQGIAAGWLNIVSHWMGEGRLVPASRTLKVPGRECRLQIRDEGPRSEVVSAVADWLLEEMQSDLATIDASHPELGLGAILTPGAAA